MEKLRRFYCFLRDRYRFLSLKKYSTIAGTLVFFLVMSIVPLTFWLTLLIGKLPISANQILSLSVFESVEKVFAYIQKEAQTATTGVSVVLLITSLYSATTLFYQMRRSGELVYDFQSKKMGLRLRLGAIILMFIVMFSVAFILLLFAFATVLFSRVLTPFWEAVADYTLLSVLALMLVFILNMYICPYKAPIKYFIPGTIFTVLAWVVAVVGFGVYLKVSNLNRLYGALSVIIVFMLWLYVMMNCFIIGVIINSEKIIKTRIKKEEKHKL